MKDENERTVDILTRLIGMTHIHPEKWLDGCLSGV
jgi:hypothetical protein